MRLLDPIVHWPAKLSEADAVWCIAARARWWPRELVVFREPGSGLDTWVLEAGVPLLHFGSLVFSKVMLSGRKTELKSVGLALRQRCPLLSIVPPLAVCGEGDSQAHPPRSVSWLCLSP